MEQLFTQLDLTKLITASGMIVILLYFLHECKKERNAELEYNRKRDQMIHEMQIKIHDTLENMKRILELIVRNGD